MVAVCNPVTVAEASTLPPIRFGKVRLRLPSTDEDHRLQVTWRNSALARRSFYSEVEVTMDGHMRWHDKLMADPTQEFFMIDLLVDPANPNVRLPKPMPVGTTCILNINQENRSAELGRLMIGSSASRGLGLAWDAQTALILFAFEHLKLNKVYGEILKTNAASRGLHKK